jgi:DNA-binding transcriptional ArsR family regulator
MVVHRPYVLWDWGTAYDLFASLYVLHNPDKFDLRGAWAAGVRSRLTADQRTIIEDAQDLFFNTPFGWLSHLPEPKDSATALWKLGQIPPPNRLPTLAFHANEPPEIFEILTGVAARGSWTERDFENLGVLYQQRSGLALSQASITTLNWWAHPDEFGERYLAALQAYVSVFFAEEERRIKPYLQQALSDAKELADKLEFPELMLELSQGEKITTFEEAEEITFVPSYWTTPLIMADCIVTGHWVVLFGARPAEAALIPGEVVPDAMLRALKALSDPTRLHILRYLRGKPQTPSQLAKKLRLRPPTVIHHLNTLRLAGLVYVTLEDEQEKRYTVRESAMEHMFTTLENFLSVKNGG